jgi:hypothetical protein
MSLIIRIVIVALSAYAGTVVAGMQSSELPDTYEVARNS